MFDFFANEFTGLRHGRFALAPRPLSPSQGLAFRHNASICRQKPAVTTRFCDGKLDSTICANRPPFPGPTVFFGTAGVQQPSNASCGSELMARRMLIHD